MYSALRQGSPELVEGLRANGINQGFPNKVYPRGRPKEAPVVHRIVLTLRNRLIRHSGRSEAEIRNPCVTY